MRPERWREVQALVEEALELDPDERGSLLDSRCRRDPSLKREVESLLYPTDQLEEFLQPDVTAPIRRAVERAMGKERPAAYSADPESGLGLDWTPKRIGSYRVERLLARTAFASVFSAFAEDGARVAVKVLHLGAGESLRRRFRVERNVLAQLDHPHIAKLLDEGTTRDGRLFLVLEFIEGRTITEYCDGEGLSLRERLDLFAQVCDAVHFAHRHLIVHRDLKPGNILVTSDGQPKLLDFGIAKVLDRSFPCTVLETTHGVRPMTPSYASPEQIFGQSISTASDTYSLGVLLFEIVSGEPPNDLAGLDLKEIRRRFRSQGVPRLRRLNGSPRLKGAAAWLRRKERISSLRIGNELESIVAMALRRRPERRYASAKDFARDVELLLCGRPVAALGNVFFYRTGKFLRRNAVALAAIAAAVGLSAFLGVETLRLRERVVAERDVARKMAGLMTDIFGQADPVRGGGTPITVLEAMDRGASQVVDSAQAEPEIQANLAGAIGSIYRSLANYPAAERYLALALKIRERSARTDQGDLASNLEEYAKLVIDRGDYRQGLELTRRAQSIRRKRVDSYPSAFVHASLLLSAVHLRTGEFWQAEEAARRAYDDSLKYEAHPALTAYAQKLLGEALLRQGRHREAAPWIEDSMRLLAESLGEAHPSLAGALMIGGELAFYLGEWRRSAELYGRAREICSTAYGDQHPLQSPILSGTARLHAARGEDDLSRSLLEESLRIRIAAYGEGSHSLVKNLWSLARVSQRMGSTGEAQRRLTQALTILESLDSPRTPNQELLLGKLLAELGRVESERSSGQESERHLRLALDHFRQLEAAETRLPSSAPARTLLELGEVFSANGSQQEAAEAWELSMRALRGDPRGSLNLPALETRAALLLRMGRIEEARPLARRVLRSGWRPHRFVELCREHGIGPATHPVDVPPGK